ncbi:hypothetical protein EZV62_025283 [Acer yangbiense]|uniref:Uncharacterized protein n=1 Tax=Acer yangbiense TaxID=1000413 RepID=A0A5C7GXE0_9ROSI|nr:hypothetical protein EZV62_025283 [Acer yangbiense]
MLLHLVIRKGKKALRQSSRRNNPWLQVTSFSNFFDVMLSLPNVDYENNGNTKSDEARDDIMWNNILTMTEPLLIARQPAFIGYKSVNLSWKEDSTTTTIGVKQHAPTSSDKEGKKRLWDRAVGGITLSCK